MEDRFTDLDSAVSLQALLGYLNFSHGKPDSRFQKQWSDAFEFLARRGVEKPWQILDLLLRAKLDELHASNATAFRDVTQVRAVLRLAFDKVLPAYRRHHADLLFHLNEADLFQPFFIARVFEAVLTQGPPWDEEERIVRGTLYQLNDFVGHRPIAILETRPRGEPYDHERVRPIPLYIRGAGVAWGRYQELISHALDFLAATDPAILVEAHFDLQLLEELALDPRAYDHSHPVNRRPNYVFGEWDPHHLDKKGRYCRYVVRQVTLDALLERVEQADASERSELLLEAAAVLAGTMLMASGISGSDPGAHDSSVSLATLMPRIARYRDAYYANLLNESPPGLTLLSASHRARLRIEATRTRQPFGGARQHLNQYLARQRAAQLQQRFLALLFAEMGYPEASRREASKIPAASVRMLSEIHNHLTTAQMLMERAELVEAAKRLPKAEDLLQRGIACGVLADPWNILGFQALFPLSAAREDSVRDVRIDELVHIVDRLLNVYSRLLSEAAAVGQKELVKTLTGDMRRLAAWWDRFASIEVSDVRRVHGEEAMQSAQHVVQALGHWHDRGEATADLAFWRQHLEGFRSPKAFALVVDALLRKQDFRAAMALLINWLSQVEQVPLDDGDHSFHTLALRWLLGWTHVSSRDGQEKARDFPRGEKLGPRGEEALSLRHARPSPLVSPRPLSDTWSLVQKFFDYLEANADEYWHVPVLELPHAKAEEDSEEEKPEETYSAAYEDVTYRDSADDDQEGSVIDGSRPEKPFDLEGEEDRLARRLHFLSTVARLWLIAARRELGVGDGPQRQETLRGWLATARKNHRLLLALLDSLHGHDIPDPLGSYDSLVEYDRRRVLKEQLLYTAISTCLDTALAIGALQGTLMLPSAKIYSVSPPGEGGSGERANEAVFGPWEPMVIRLEQALLHGDVSLARATLPAFLELFKTEPLLFKTLADGGEPRKILRVRIAQTVLRALVTNLPRLGLLRETYHLLRTARAMEQSRPAGGRGISEFNFLFQAGYQAVVESVVCSADSWDTARSSDRELADLLETLTGPFLSLWIEHSQTLQLSFVETMRAESDWQALRRFIKRYGNDLFHARFLTLANLRGILHRGVGAYLDYLRDNPDPLHAVRLIDDLDGKIEREQAERYLQFVLQAVVENYEEYKDYNATTTQSDYGENLHILLDFLRLKAHYERDAWQFRPLVLAHEVLARKGRAEAAIMWQEAFTHIAQEMADKVVKELDRLEQTHGVCLPTISDRIHERFVKPLALDRLCALVEPAMAEAAGAGPYRALAQMEQELEAYTANPTGVGLDVPDWLRRLEAEVRRVRATRTEIAVLAENLFQVSRRQMTYEEVWAQLQEWEKL